MAAAIICVCCKRPLRIPENVLGQLVQCPLCLDEFVAQADPAAEIAVRRAEAPVKRAAGRSQPVAAPIPAEPEPQIEEFEELPVWVEPAIEPASPRKPAREAPPVKTLVFQVLAARDPDRILRGRMDAELTADGLYLRKPRHAAAFAAVGGKARYLGANRIVVTVEGREVELTVVKPWTSVYHLARDIAGFLNGNNDFPNGRAYDVPWLLHALPSLFVALPFAACPLGLLTDGCGGVLLWCLVAAMLAGAAFAVALQPRLLPRTRLIGAGGLVGLGALIYLLAFFFTPSYDVDVSLWRTYMPPDGGFHVKLPGSPTVARKPARAFIADPDEDAVTYTVDVKEPEVRFVVSVSPNATINGGVHQLFGGDINNFQANTDAKNRIQQDFLLGSLFSYTESIAASPGGPPCRQFVYKIKAGYGSSETEKTLVARIDVALDRTYTLIIVGPKVREDSADALKFFDSFQINQPIPGGRWPPAP